MSEKTLFIIRGVPGAGKSTLANKITKNVVEADQFMYVDGEYKWSANKLNYAHLCCRNKVKEYMAEGKNRIAVANTFIKRKDMKPYIAMAEEYGYKTKIITCIGNYQNVHNVPQETVDKMRKKFQETLQLNENWSEIEEFTDIYFTTQPSDILNEYKNNPSKNIWLPLIKPSEYKQALTEFMKYGEIVRYPEDKIKNWLDIIFKNTSILNSFTELAGHSSQFPNEEINEVYPETKNMKDYSEYSEFLQNIGFYDWAKLPDGSDAISDYGITPIMEIINEYDESMSVSQILVLINRCLDVWHHRGDLASAFIEGGSSSLTQISNECIKNNGNQLNESNEENLEEMAYPMNFNLEQFSQLPSFAARVRYCNERLQKLGAGTARIAYKVDDEKVLKIAKNNKGIAQNTAECDWSRNEYECFAKIFEADTDNYTWVEMEIARRAKPTDFKKILGISFKELVDIIYAIYNQYAYSGRKIGYIWFNTSIENAEKLLEEWVYSGKSEYLHDLYNYMLNYQPLMVQDWSRLANWGVVTRNGQEIPVIIDVGVNADVELLYRR